MTEALREIVARKGDDVALIDEAGTTTWRELDERANQAIHAMRAAGLDKGDPIALLCGNRRELFEIVVGALHAGLIIVPVNWHWVADEVAYVLQNSGAKVFFADARFRETAEEAVAQASTGALNVMVGAQPGGHLAEPFVDYTEWLHRQPADDPPDQGFGGPMFYTSGTTGRPKGVRHSVDTSGSASFLALAAQLFTEQLGVPAEGVTLLCGPAYHSAQFGWSVFPLLGGSTVVMRHRFDPAETLELIDAYGVTNVHLVPTQMTRMLRLPDEVRATFDGASLVVIHHGAAPCPPEVKREMIEWWGPVFVEYYGGTEGALISTIDSHEWAQHPTSVGKPWSTVEITIRSDDNVLCGIGEPGTIWIRNVLGIDFEYHGDPDKTASAHAEPGVFTLGDIGYLDAEGYLHLSDRKIDMIISGGVNIYPAEIEGVLASHGAVRDVAVFGIPDDEYGEQVKAVVELEDGHDASDALAAQLVDFCRERLAGYKCPKSIDFEQSLPRYPTGKLYKRLLRDPYWEGAGRSI